MTEMAETDPHIAFTPEMVQAVVDILYAWDHEELEYPEDLPGNPYDIVAGMMLKAALDVAIAKDKLAVGGDVIRSFSIGYDGSEDDLAKLVYLAMSAGSGHP